MQYKERIVGDEGEQGGKSRDILRDVASVCISYFFFANESIKDEESGLKLQESNCGIFFAFIYLIFTIAINDLPFVPISKLTAYPLIQSKIES